MDFTNPDFVKLGEGFGMPAWRCESADDFARRLTHALGLDVPSLIDAADRLLAGRCHHRGTGNGDSGHMSIATGEREVVDKVEKQLYIGGEWRDASGGGTLGVEDPATGETICESPTAPTRTPSRRSTRPSRRTRWRDSSPNERSEILWKAFEELNERRTTSRC